MSFTKIKNQNAFALIELLIVSGLLAIISLAGASMIQNQHRGIKQNEEIMERNEIVSSLKRFTESPVAIFKTYETLLPVNPNHRFVACLENTSPASDCSLTGMPVLGWDLDFYNQQGMRVSGTVSDPVFYNDRGALCAESRCAFRAETRFIPICPNNANDCQQALSVKINFKLTPMTGQGVAQSRAFQTEPFAGITDVSEIFRTNIQGAYFGGMYDTNTNHSCIHANPLTSGCTCPIGFDSRQISRFDAAGSYGTGDGYLYFCYRSVN